MKKGFTNYPLQTPSRAIPTFSSCSDAYRRRDPRDLTNVSPNEPLKVCAQSAAQRNQTSNANLHITYYSTTAMAIAMAVSAISQTHINTKSSELKPQSTRPVYTITAKNDRPIAPMELMTMSFNRVPDKRTPEIHNTATATEPKTNRFSPCTVTIDLDKAYKTLSNLRDVRAHQRTRVQFVQNDKVDESSLKISTKILAAVEPPSPCTHGDEGAVPPSLILDGLETGSTWAHRQLEKRNCWEWSIQSPGSHGLWDESANSRGFQRCNTASSSLPSPSSSSSSISSSELKKAGKIKAGTKWTQI